MRTKRAVVLLSGGLDSTTTLAIAKDQGFKIYGLTFRYGQRHEVEIACASRVAATLQIRRHVIWPFDLREFGGSALTSDMPVPKGRSQEEMDHGIPITYVPARNTIFLSVALAWAEVLGAFDIFIGVNALDYSGYPDCRPEFIQAFQHMCSATWQIGGCHLLPPPFLTQTDTDLVSGSLNQFWKSVPAGASLSVAY